MDPTRGESGASSPRVPESQLRLFIEHAPTAVAMFDREMRYLAASTHWRADYRLEGNLIGRSHYEVFPEIGDAWKAVHRRALAGEVVSAEEDRFERADGRVQWLRWEVRPWFDAPGAVAGIVIWAEDITENRQAHAILYDTVGQLSATFDNAAVGIATCGADGRWRRVNDRLCAIAGWPREELIGRFFGDITHPDDLAEDLARGRALFDGDIPNYVMEKRYLRKDGTSVWVNLTVGLVRKPDGTPDYFVSVVEDISLRKSLEAERERYVSALRDADRRKDEFLAMLAHELRNPLAPIVNAVQLIEALGPADAQLRRGLDIIARQVTHLARLVDDLLDVSRVTSGKIMLVKARVDLAQVIRAGVELARPLIDAKRQTLALHLPASGTLCVDGDATRLTQVIGNLLNNAVKYTESHGRIEIHAAQEAQEALISVRDNGIGIEPELLPHVFELFSQAERSLDRAQGGLGIGLSLVRSLVELHGGSVSASSAGRGRGSEFTVRLPLLASAPLDTRQREVAHAGAAPRPRRILLVDDNVDSAESLRLLLELKGHQVSVVHHGPAALDRAPAFRPEICLLDIGLPGMDGFELARRLHALPQAAGAAYFAVSGYGQEADRQRAHEAGFERLLVKPVSPDLLFTLIDALPARTAA